MPAINYKAVGHQKNIKAYKLPLTLHLQYRIEVETEDHTLLPACCTIGNQKMQIGVWKIWKRRNSLVAQAYLEWKSEILEIRNSTRSWLYVA